MSTHVISPENRRAQVKAIMEKIEKEGLGPGETFEGKLKAEIRRQNAAERAAEFTRDHPNLVNYIEEVMVEHEEPEQHSSGFSRHNDHRKARPKGAYPNPVPDPDPDPDPDPNPYVKPEAEHSSKFSRHKDHRKARPKGAYLDEVIEEEGGEKFASGALGPDLQLTAAAPHLTEEEIGGISKTGFRREAIRKKKPMKKPSADVFAVSRGFNPKLTGRNHSGGSRKSKHSKKKNTLRKASSKVSRKQTRKPTRKASRKSSRKQSRKQSRKPTKKSKKKKASRN